MKIENIKVNSYGILKEKEINLKDNLNIIYGKMKVENLLY